MSLPRYGLNKLKLINGKWTRIAHTAPRYGATHIEAQIPIIPIILSKLITFDKGDRRLLGITIPLKPTPPKDGECCMSGCAHCVYDVHLEDLQHYHSLISDAKKAVLNKARAERIQLSKEEWPKEFGEMEFSTELSKAEIAEKEAKELMKSLPSAQRAFLEFEAMMRKKKAEKLKLKSK